VRDTATSEIFPSAINSTHRFQITIAKGILVLLQNIVERTKLRRLWTSWQGDRFFLMQSQHFFFVTAPEKHEISKENE